MHIGLLAVSLAAIVILVPMAIKRLLGSREGLSGYGILSGLNYNNNERHCFKNQYDPEWYDGYCTTIGRVVV